MQKLYPRKLPGIRCQKAGCDAMARRTDWVPVGYDSRLRQFVCRFGHISYKIVGAFYMETEIYLGRELER